MEETKRCPFCAEEILAAAIKCKHCGSNLADIEHSSTTRRVSSRSDLGWMILSVPLVGAFAVLFWVGNMNLLQGPQATLALVGLLVMAATAALCAAEAVLQGMRTDRKERTSGPVEWAFALLLIWPIAYGMYLFKRRKYGLRNFLVAGIVVEALFLGSIFLVELMIEANSSALRQAANAAVTPGHFAAPSSPPTPPTPNLTAHVEVGLLGLLTVKNGDSFDWKDCLFTVNAHTTGGGYSASQKIIAHNKEDGLLLVQFIDTDGTRFDPERQAVKDIQIKCDTPQGRGSYSGSSE